MFGLVWICIQLKVKFSKFEYVNVIKDNDKIGLIIVDILYVKEVCSFLMIQCI